MTNTFASAANAFASHMLANEGVVFSHLTRCLGNKKKVAISALFCIKTFPLVIFMLGDNCQ